ncbi:MAG TPA: hypothetical protein VF180_13355 [Acidimicrobiia bacterium]
MATYYGIEQNTDTRAPQTTVVRLPSEQAAREWVQRNQGFAFPGSARGDLPGSQQNWHRRVRRVYVMPPGFRLSRRELREALALRRCRSQRFVSEDDVKADLLAKYQDATMYVKRSATP